MLKGNKILIIIFAVLLLVALAEAGYYFFMWLGTQKMSVDNTQVTNSSDEAPIKKVPSPTIVTKEERVIQKPINLLPYLALVDTKQAKLIDGVLFIDNSDNDEFYGIVANNPITINSPFRLRLRFKREAQGNNVQLTLVNKKPSQGVKIQEIDFMDFHDVITIEVRDGTSTGIWGAGFPEIKRGDTFYVEFLDSSGKQFAVINKEGTILRTIDVTKLDKVTLPDGLFSEKKMIPGIIIGPRAKLRVDEFVLTFLPK